MNSSLQPVPISPVEEIVAEMRAGRMVVLVDEEDRENEGDLVLASDHVTAEAINFMARFGRGLICLTLTRERCEFLKLPPMAARNGTVYSTAFTISIEAAEGVTTGISAADRARTVQVAVNKNSQPSDLVQPGHVFPLQAVDGGVLMRAGHTEAGCDLAALAGCTPSAVICEIMKDDGTMARLPDLQLFCAEHGIKIGTIADLIEYRSRNESLQKVGSRPMRRRPMANSSPMPSATCPAAPCTWHWSRANGSPTPPCPCACTSRCRCSMRSKPAATSIPGAWTRASSTSTAMARAWPCCSTAASGEQLLTQFEGKARRPGARARPHGPAHLWRGRADPARAGRERCTSWASPAACPAWPATAWKSRVTSPKNKRRNTRCKTQKKAKARTSTAPS
jgi:3,4-dihydroxy 2-butanone 4-phosphate synthase/GTP cyclohydrolase II